jgi:xyloglucan-specific exo-beta-1,4-glucanase
MAKSRSTIASLGLGMIAVSLLSAATTARAPLYTWRNVTVGGGGFAPGIVFSAAARGLAYLRTDMGGAYRFDTKLARWVPLQDGNAIGGYMGVESVAADPVDPNVVYLAAGMSLRGEAAILRSADRGANWAVTPVPFKMGGNEDGRGLGERLAIDPNRTTRLLFGSRHDGLWRSVDRGAHWVKVAAFPLTGLGTPTVARTTHGGLSFVLFDKTRPGRVFVASADPGAPHLFRSDDDGATWAAVAGGPEARMLPVKAVLGSDGVLTISYANGIGPNGSWAKASNGLAVDLYGLGRAAPGAKWPAVYAIGRKDGVQAVWRSIDGGAGWQRINDERHQWGLRFRVISGDPKTYGRVYIGTDGRGIVYGDPAFAKPGITKKD